MPTTRKKLTSDQKTMRKVARKLKTIMEKDLSTLEDSTTKGWFNYILKDVYNFIHSASQGVNDSAAADLAAIAHAPPSSFVLSEEQEELAGDSEDS
tara:strand:- start:244 stop:531 length:288 start_codon:yes stop_codon:yes gene_type:complete